MGPPGTRVQLRWDQEMTQPLRVISVDLQRGWRGGENQVYLLQRGLREAGVMVQTRVLCRAGQPLAERLQAEGLACDPVPGTWAAIRSLRRAIRGGEVDLLHAHTGRAHGLCLLAARGQVPLVVTRRVAFPVGGGLSGRWKYSQRVARFVAISSGVRAVLEAGGVDPTRISLIPSGVDPARVVDAADDGLRAELGLPDDEPLVLCAGALSASKGHRHLLDAWARIERERPRGHLLLAGSGELEEPLRLQARHLGLHRVQFLGWREDVPRLLAASTVFALSSVEEGLGTVLVDAAFAGVPMVASAAGGIPDVVEDGVTGLLCPVADPAAFALALTRMLDEPGLRAALATAARERAVERFHYRGMATAYAQLYAELTGDRG